MALALLALLAAGCAAIETPAPALTPTPTQAPATATPTNTPAATPTPPPSPTATTPAPSPTVIGRRGTPQPLAFSRQGDTLPTRPATSPTAPRHQFATSIPCTVSTAGLTLREGPGPGYRLISSLSPATTVTAYKCVPGASWLLVETAQGQIGWVQTAFLNCQGDIADLPVAQGLFAQPGPSPDPGTQAAPSPTATSPPAPVADAWRGEYFANPELAGQPVLVRNDPSLEFDWALDSPDPNIPPDNFSVRWTRVFNLETSDYRFLARADDGIKVYLDGWLVIDQWRETVPRTHIGEFGDVQAGPHTITVEYFEAGGLAHIQFWFEQTVLIENAWVGEYFNNRDWQGEPVLVRADEDIDFDWDDDAPVDGMDDDRFSVRWRRSIHFDAGDYRFSAEVGDEDMVRILLDGWLIVDRYREDSGEISGRFDQLGEGYHTVVVEFQERGEEAKIEVDWEIDD